MTERRALHYQVAVARHSPQDATVEAAPRVVIRGGPPPEFGGDATVWSPEHLLVASAALCYWSTLEWFARRRAVPVVGFECHGEGDVEKTARGLAFTAIRLDVTATTTSGQEAQLGELLQTAKDACLVARSLACPVELDAHVKVQDATRSALGVAL